MLELFFAYPPYFDYRRNLLVHRPLDSGKRLEIIRYIQRLPLDVDIPLDASAMERWVAQTLLGFANTNDALTLPRAASRRRTLVRRARVAATRLAHYALAELLRDPPTPFPVERTGTWLGRPDGRSRDDAIAQHERQTQMIALVLARPHPPARPSQEQIPNQQARRPEPPTANRSAGAQPGLFGFGRRKPQAQTEVEAPGPARPREASADLLELYGEYLSDMQPEMTTHQTAAIPRATNVGDRSAGAPPGAGDAQTDMQVFYQLRFQIEGYVRKAARSYGLPNVPGDPAHVIEALRASNLVDESDLRMAEGILALTDRVIADGMASMHDLRQALMLYLLYHRSHLA
jgi:hypothetical protein